MVRIFKSIKNRVKVIGFIKKVWGWIANEDWINILESIATPFALILSLFVVLYLLFDILGKVPEALHINLVMVSATLGGLVFAGASFTPKGSDGRKLLMNVAKKFIVATFLFLIFFIFFVFIGDKNVAPFSLDFYKNNSGYAIMFWIAAVGLYGGSIYFTLALVNLMFSLKTMR